MFAMNNSASVSYILSSEVLLTGTCNQKCGHCSVVNNDSPLLSLKDLNQKLKNLSDNGASEVALISGEYPQDYPHIQIALSQYGFTSFYDYLREACLVALSHKLIPVLRVGYLDSSMLASLENTGAVIKIDVVSSNQTGAGECFEFARRRTPKAGRKAIEAVHGHRIPYSLGFITGIGESESDRLEMIRQIGEFCGADPYLQDVRIAYFQPEPNCLLKHRPPLGFESVKRAVIALRRAFPVHHISIPPFLFNRYPELVEHGLNDLGSVPIFTGSTAYSDFFMPSYENMKLRLLKINSHLYERSPLTTPAAMNRPELSETLVAVNQKIEKRNRAPISLIDNDYCFVCGVRNPISLKIPTKASTKGNTCTFTWTPGPHFQSYAGVLHGGIINTLLDEAMGYAIMGENLCRLIVTADMKVKYLRPAPIGLPITIAATVSGQKRNHIFARGSVISQDGSVIAEAEGHFVEMINKAGPIAKENSITENIVGTTHC